MENFNIICNNENEYIFIQKILFKKGYEWLDTGKTLFNMHYKYPLYIYNINNGLCIATDFSNLGCDKSKITEAKHFMRNEKLKRIQ